MQKRGVSGRMIMPTQRMMDQANCTAMGMRYEPVSMRSLDELLTTLARRRPMVMASWYAPTMAPRIHLGAVSLW
jgi:hypothetical protein